MLVIFRPFYCKEDAEKKNKFPSTNEIDKFRRALLVWLFVYHKNFTLFSIPV